jgi:predicted molibdopterin-dependent oxidoreductase YjgC
MKLILILVLLMAAQTHAGLFDNDEQRIREYEQQLNTQRESTGDWMVIAGILAIGGIVLFGVGAAIGAKVRKEVKKYE